MPAAQAARLQAAGVAAMLAPPSAMINVASGASWVSLHNGGGVGIGYSQHSGIVVVADGTKRMDRRLENVLTADPGMGVIRHVDSGYEEVPTWNGKEWMVDTDCDFDRIYIWEPEYFERYICYDLKFDDKTGDTIKWDNGYDAFIAYAKAYDNLGSRAPNAHVCIKNLAVPTF
jgi:hypothetical protein